MKNIMISMALFALTLNTIAGNEKGGVHGDKYCAKMKDGKTTVMYQGNTLTADVTLQNGTTVKTDGTIIKKDGSKMMLKEGECINKDGTMMMKERKEMKEKKEPIK